MPTARELLEEVDALMRRNRGRDAGPEAAVPEVSAAPQEALATPGEGEGEPPMLPPAAVTGDDDALAAAAPGHAAAPDTDEALPRNEASPEAPADAVGPGVLPDDDIPVLTDVAVEDSGTGALQSGLAEDDDVPVLTDVITEFAVGGSPSDAAPPAGAAAPGHAAAAADAMAALSDQSPEAFSGSLEPAPVVDPGEPLLPGAPDIALHDIATEIAHADAARQAVIDEAMDAELASTIDVGPILASPPADLPGQDPSAAAAGSAAEPPDEAVSASPGPTHAMPAAHPADAPSPLPPVTAETSGAPAPAVQARLAADDPRWETLAEDVRMQVLQRIDLFTETGLHDELRRHLQPIVDRASAELVATINREVGQVLRAYVAQAIEREIDKWRHDGH